jgi:hypothetical protein
VAEQKAEIFNDTKHMNKDMQILRNQVLKNGKFKSHSMPVFSANDITSLFQQPEKNAESDENVNQAESNFIEKMLPQIPDNSKSYFVPRDKLKKRPFESKSTFTLPFL